MQKCREEGVKRDDTGASALAITPNLANPNEYKRDQIILHKNCIQGPPNHRLAIQNPTNDSVLLQLMNPIR